MVQAVLVGMALGVVTEIIAYGFSFWKYHKTVSPQINILVMFGLIMGGGISSLQASVGLPGVFAIGAAVGYAYEWANFIYLDWWIFPCDRFLVFRGRHGCATSVGIMWGAVPVLIALLSGILFS